MPDADWYKYKPLRGKELPETFEFQGVTYRRVKLLKRDFYAAVGLYEFMGERRDVSPSVETRTPGGLTQRRTPSHILLKVYHTDPFWGFPLRWLGRWLAHRERFAYEALHGIEGIPKHLGTWGESGLLREFIPGCNLREYRAIALPDKQFYPELARILADVHARGMSHNDLAKPENIVVSEEGRPILIDFQIALGPRRGSLLQRVIRYMQGIDRYHLAKHHTHDRPDDFTPEEREQALKKGTLLWMHGKVVRVPYRAVRHLILRRWLVKDEGRKAA